MSLSSAPTISGSSLSMALVLTKISSKYLYKSLLHSFIRWKCITVQVVCHKFRSIVTHDPLLMMESIDFPKLIISANIFVSDQAIHNHHRKEISSMLKSLVDKLDRQHQQQLVRKRFNKWKEIFIGRLWV
jgi:hypothetical protein